jgi:hypothetical protein
MWDVIDCWERFSKNNHLEDIHPIANFTVKKRKRRREKRFIRVQVFFEHYV